MDYVCVEDQKRIEDHIDLRSRLYVTITSNVDVEEAVNKLLEIKLESGKEMVLCMMLLECCCQEKTYKEYYAQLAQRLCTLNKVYQEYFSKCFAQQYSMVRGLDIKRPRHAAKFFAHLMVVNVVPMGVLARIGRKEEDVRSCPHIGFITTLLDELSEHRRGDDAPKDRRLDFGLPMQGLTNT